MALKEGDPVFRVDDVRHEAGKAPPVLNGQIKKITAKRVTISYPQNGASWTTYVWPPKAPDAPPRLYDVDGRPSEWQPSELDALQVYADVLDARWDELRREFTQIARKLADAREARRVVAPSAGVAPSGAQGGTP